MSHYNKEMVSVYTNTTCNLDCKYCYTNKEEFEAQVIDLEFAKQLIRDYFSLDDYKGFKPVVRFFAAGEPTLNFEAIKAITEWVHEQYDDRFGDTLEFELQSNGIYINEHGEYDYDKAKWIAHNIDYIWISCDGTPDVQNEYRPIFEKAFDVIPKMTSSEIVEETIKYILPICKKMIGVRMTIINSNISRQKEMIDYFVNLGIRDIWADPLFPGVGRELIEDIDLPLFARQFLEACNYASEKYGKDIHDPSYDSVIYGSNYTCNFDEETNHYCRACKPVPHATTDGYVTACDMAMFCEDINGRGAHMNQLLYGKWNPGEKTITYWPDKIEMLRNRNCIKMHACNNCIARHHCGGYCLGEVTNETHQVDGQIKNKCQVVRTLYMEMNKRQRKYRYSHP